MTIKNSCLIPGKLYKIDNEFDNQEYNLSFFSNEKRLEFNKSNNVIVMFLYKKFFEKGKEELDDIHHKYFYLLNNQICYNYVYNEELSLNWFDDVE